MSVAELPNEGLRKHARKLGCIQCTGIFSGFFEWVESGVEVPREWGSRGTWWEVVGGGTGKRSYLL